MSFKNYKKRTTNQAIADWLWLAEITVRKYWQGKLKNTATERKIAKYLRKVQMEELGGYLTDE